MMGCRASGFSFKSKAWFTAPAAASTVADNSAPPVIKKKNFQRLVARRSDALHPWRYITGAAGRGAAFGRVKRLAVWLLYEYMARTYSQADWTTMNYGYATLQGEDGRTVVDPAIPERLSLQLYMRIATAGARGGAWGGLDACFTTCKKGSSSRLLEVRGYLPDASHATTCRSAAAPPARGGAERTHDMGTDPWAGQ